MDLYFSPLACSLASRIALYEAGLEAGFHQVTLSTKTLPDGGDYWQINPTGQVPALRTDDGAILTEGPAVLQFIADRAPGPLLAPPAGTLERARMQQWLSYVGTEVQKAVFYMIFRPDIPADMKAFARETLLAERFTFLDRHLTGRNFLLDTYSVADAYLITTLNWAALIGADFTKWPALAAYRDRILARPAVAKALSEEMALRAAG